MGYLSGLFRRSEYTFQDTAYYRRLDTDSRTPALLNKLKLQGYGDLKFLISEAVLIPEKWNQLKQERIADRQARRRVLADKLTAVAQAIRDDPDICCVTTFDSEVLVQTYAKTDDLAKEAEKGVITSGLPSLSVDLTDERLTGNRATHKRRTVTIASRVSQSVDEKLSGYLGGHGKYPVPALAEYLIGVAECLSRDDWPDRYDGSMRQHVPRKKAARTAMRTFVTLAIFDLLTTTIDAGRIRAPNEETAMLTNILLGLHGSNALTGGAVSEARKDKRRRYCTE